MSDIYTSIEIDAPAGTVMVGPGRLRGVGWNPCARIEGGPRVGERLRVSLGPEAGRSPTFRPRALVADGRELRRIGHLLTPGLFDGEHSFVVEFLDEGRSKLTQSETFSGLLVGPVLRFVGEQTESNFRGVNDALESRVARRR